jgi:UDP-N-acetylglucosamine--N-acetylmuramyl-(pentapeptide) pyrophosphoryl-undecaprenol N-acetylglucosamine transferase
MPKHILITAGGTGGHIYPAQGLAQQLIKRVPDVAVLFVAGGLSSNRYFDSSFFAFQEVATGPLLSKHPLKALKGWGNLGKGIWQSIKILKKYQPSAVVGLAAITRCLPYWQLSYSAFPLFCMKPIAFLEKPTSGWPLWPSI